MRDILRVLAIMLVSIAMALSLAHALELPGKRRLDERTYRAVQPIYYPGFTYGGLVGDVGGLVAAAVLLAMTPVGTAAFWLTAAAFLCLLGMHGVYWLLTHPVNKVWLHDQALTDSGRKFFAAGRSDSADRPWTELRDRWEYSHVARAILATISLLLLVLPSR
ncbi:DUF1772 domain-containing protein [Nocardia sp. ET3-3]|uniref:DUF1772 domain-containing protein n=1 Tax=Nocardia terrae TaxID=2675851 RepID=A0A7K1VAV9_9NOCA|nr:DUF1772 domain-containing protein [Nocardia terrae]MVU83784.1 DUF1772 domain-containing protein [Nocardia terrae]